jgi:hypothetical protein
MKKLKNVLTVPVRLARNEDVDGDEQFIFFIPIAVFSFIFGFSLPMILSK